MDDTLHDLIYRQASAREIRKRAMQHGMRTLQTCGWNHAKHGLTSLSEIMRYADFESEDETAENPSQQSD